MKKNGYLFVFGLTLVACLMMGISPGQSGAESKKPFKIGYIDSLSGAYTFYAKDNMAGLEVAVEEVNAKGGILGRKIEILVRDDKLKPEISLRHAKDLVLKEKVDMVTGTVSSNCALSMTAFLRDNKVPFFVTGSQSATTTVQKGHRYVFRISTNTDIYSYSDAAAAAKMGITKWWTLNPDYEYGHISNKGFREALTKLNPKVEFVGEGWPKLGTTDLTSFINPIMNSEAGGVYSSMPGGFIISLVKNGNAVGLFKKVAVLGHDLGSPNTYHQFGKNYPEGIWGGTQYPFWLFRENPRNEEFYQKVLKKRGGAPPALGAPCSYSTIMAIVQAAEKVQSTDMEKIIDTLEGMTIDTLVGPVLIHKYDHQAEWPYYFGKTKYVKEYPFPILTDVTVFKGEGYRSEQEVMKARAAAK
jgi:branched-chain amino acid transport system substrate-binding protein